jgi:hypothetical protein
MPALQCLTCEHDNPVEAKFCSECGWQLNLRLCKQCEAINERSWQRCHSCATELGVDSFIPKAAAAMPEAPHIRMAPLPSEPPPRKHSLATHIPSPRLLVSALLLAALATFGYSLYRQPGANPHAIEASRNAPGGANVGNATVVSVVPAAASVEAVDASVIKPAASVSPVRKSRQPATRAHDAGTPTAPSSRTKAPAPVTAADRSLSSSQQSAGNTLAPVAPKRDNEQPSATGRAKGVDPSRAKSKVSASARRDSGRAGTADDFQLLAPPP